MVSLMAAGHRRSSLLDAHSKQHHHVENGAAAPIQDLPGLGNR